MPVTRVYRELSIERLIHSKRWYQGTVHLFNEETFESPKNKYGRESKEIEASKRETREASRQTV